MPELDEDEDSIPNDGYSSSDSIRVIVTNEAGAGVPEERVEAAVQAALANVDYGSIEVSVAIVDDPTIHELNREFLDHDYPTDVLSFPLEDTASRLEGEIVVSADTAARCAIEAGWSATDELLLYVVHGALHLAGYRDKESQDAGDMRRREAAVLKELGITLSAQDSRWHADMAREDDTR
jgi:probable rRNA maturation factor